MDLLEQLGVALGLASLAGVNLYLTVLLTGVLVRFDWLHLADKYQHLEVFGHPVVLTVAGVLFVMEFFADKIPWVDSLWDSVHTVIRPVGGTLLALQALGSMDPWMQVAAGLVAGSAALTTHSAKASTRLLINHSPEPFSNIAMSLTEDIAVVAGSIFVLMKPVIALGVFAAIIVIIWMIFPRIFRVIRTSLWLIWNKLRMPGRRESLTTPVELTKELDGDLLALLATHASTSEHEVAWTAPCITGKGKGMKGLKGNFKAMIVAKNESKTMLLAVMGGLRDRLFEVPLADSRIDVDSRFLSENLVIESSGKTVVLRFPRGQTDLVETVAMRLRQLAGPAVPSIPEAEAVKEELAPVPAV
jgi:Domain of unknown function (DUF4126)